jgi:phenylalanyl-tRNA synthetase beta chain
MYISLNWLRDFVDWTGSTSELDDLFTRAGVKVESMEEKGAEFPGIVVAQILESGPHPNADRLSVCRVEDGSGQPRQIVCGAQNYRTGDKVPLALPGAVLPGGVKIKVGKLRGIESEGMLCSAKELGLADDAEGLLILPNGASVGGPLSEVYPADSVFELEITPNRADWLSHVGLAREVAAFSGESFHLADIEVPKVARTHEGIVSVQSKELCPFYSVRRVRNVNVGPSPQWLSDRLMAVGLRSINNIVDITNYVMLELGQPLHAFDASKVHGQIVVRRAHHREEFSALDGNTYQLSANDLTIADSEGPIALAGVMGGEKSGVTGSTTEVLLESAYFEPSSVRHSARFHNLHSESSYRFERGVDPSGVLAASARAARLIEEVAGGKGDEAVVVAGALPAPQSPVPLRLSRCRLLLGADVPAEEVRNALIRLGLEPVAESEELVEWKIPSHRRDLAREVDLIEEVARVIGIERIPSRIAAAPAPPSEADAVYDFRLAAREQLYALGLSEARTSTLVSERMLWRGAAALRLRNPVGEDQAFLRTSLLPGLIAALERNIRHGAQSVALYEVGRTFHPGESEERETLAMTLYGESASRNWRGGGGREFDWHDAKGILEALVAVPVNCVRAQGEPYLALCAEVFAGGKRVGILGQLAPAFARTLDATKPVLVAEVSFDILRALWRTPAFHDIPKFPAVVRDIAIVCPIDLPYGEIESELWKAKEELLERIEPFDIYRDPSGEKLPVDCKSIAISLTFRAQERTLGSEEVNAACERLKQQLKAKLAVDFRE